MADGVQQYYVGEHMHDAATQTLLSEPEQLPHYNAHLLANDAFAMMNGVSRQTAREDVVEALLNIEKVWRTCHPMEGRLTR